MTPTVSEIIIMVVLGIIAIPLLIYGIIINIALSLYLFKGLFIDPFRRVK